MPLWKRLWLLFAVIWGVVAALNAGTILVASEEPQKALAPLAFGVAVPAALYLVLSLWALLSSRRGDRGQ
jgi:hypothetical protein